MNLNDLPQIRNIEQLQAVMADVSKAPVDLDEMIWFACIGQAETLDSATLKDLGRLFLNGVPKMDVGGVLDHLLSFFDPDDVEQHKDGNRYLIASIARFYGDYDLSNAIVDVDSVIEHE